MSKSTIYTKITFLVIVSMIFNANIYGLVPVPKKPIKNSDKFDYTSFVLNDSYLKQIIQIKETSPNKLAKFVLGDNDGDTVDDVIDLDDDNDGILDEVENSCDLISGYDGYWDFDNDGAVDLSGNGHNLQNSPTLTYNSTEKKSGSHSLQFNGTSSTMLQYSDGTFLNQGITNFTYAFWVRPESLSGEQTLIDEGASGRGFTIRLNGSTLECALNNNTSVYSTSTFTVNINQWYHIAATFAAGDITLYLNGIPSTTVDTQENTLTGHSNPSGLGGTNGQNAFTSGSGHFFTGQMDQVLHYPIALTNSQINQIVNMPNCTPEDTDNDGVYDYLDLDSDNDGIPDNYEAQATNSYIAPGTFTDNNGDGVNDVYAGGLTPLNSDNDASPDYQDINSDNEGDSDTVEAGLSLTGVVGTNGLDSNYENNDNYTEPDGNLSPLINFPDTDNDLNSGGDVDFRDNTVSVPFSFTTGDSATSLANAIAGSGVTISNETITIGSGTQVGTFVGGISGKNLQIDSGIILTTGTVTESFSENTSTSSSNYNEVTDDTDLASLASSSVNDQVVFEFDALLDPLATVLTIDYQFASDEYNEWVCSAYNDVFGYFVTEPVSNTTQNIAIVPGTADLTVAINHINNGTPSGSNNDCELGYSSYFIENPQSSGNLDMEYDGFTTKIRASATGLSPGVLYHVKFAIGDVGDSGYDSAILINLISGYPDTDNDGIPNDEDIDDDNDGILDVVEDSNADNDNNPLSNPTDSDNDGIYNFLDLDSDGDGIPDNIEAQSTLGYITPNFVYNANGLDTAYEGTGGLTPINTDNTDEDDYLDTNSDNEGDDDTMEADLTLSGVIGANGLDNNIDTADNYADVNGNINTATSLPDSDNDYNSGGDVDFRDAITFGDNDGDGVDDSTDIDDDNDGILDTEEGFVLDTDNDGILNYLDLDSDGDGIPDNIEAQSTLTYISPNFAYNVNGLDTAYEGAGGLSPVNTDGTDEEDYLDSNSDNEGDDDTMEAGLTLSGIIGLNGLDSNIYTSNDYTDVNGIINDPELLPDSDTDLNLGGDVDFRDDTINITAGTGNLLWLRADIEATTSLWQDQSGNDKDATATTTPVLNSNTVNFNPSFSFNGSNQFMQITNGILGNNSYTDMWVYIVSSVNTIQNSSIFREEIANTERFGSHLPWGDNNAYFDLGEPDANSGRIQSAWGGTIDKFHLWNFNQSNTSSNPSGNNKAMYRDGLRIASASSNDNSILGNNSNFYIGTDNTNYFDGDIAEIIVFADIPSNTEQQSLQSYLAIKYGVTLDDTDNTAITEGTYLLSNGTTKVWDYDSNSTYHNDVAGIGRDDTRDFEQKQSKSINSGTIVTMGLGTIANDNNSNANSFTEDKDFLMWGHSPETTTSTATSVLCSSSDIMDRVWKVVETGDVGTVQIAGLKSEIGTYLNTNLEIAIKIADDEQLTTNVEFISLTESTINGLVQLSGTYDFDGTKYFTFTEVVGITWSGGTSSWDGGSSINTVGAPNTEDDNQLVTIDSENTSNHAVLEEDIEIGCLWIKPNSVLTVKTGYSLVIEDELKIDGELRVMKDAQLIQNHTGESLVTGTGNIHIDQTFTAATVYQYNYVTSPVVSVGHETFSVGDVLKDGTIPTNETSSITPITFKNYISNYDELNGALPSGQNNLTIANYWIYSYLNGISGTSWIQEKETGSFEPGEAFILKGPGAPQNYTFVGTPNDGDITINMNAYHYSLLGNPYPSALNLDAFLLDNPIVNTLYFWQQTGDGGNHNQALYEGGYATINNGTYTEANYVVEGTIGLGNGNYDTPTNRIPVAQGFLLQTGAIGGDITFKNSHRIHEPVGSGSVFFKGKQKQSKANSNELSVIKVGFEYNNTEGENIHRQIAVSFKEGNSFAQDTGYDSLMYDLDETDVYFKFENNRDIYVIAGVEPISPSLEVPITIVNEESATVYLMLDVIENIEQTVYLKDNLTEETQELDSPIALSLDEGTYSNRFSLAFTEDEIIGTDKEKLQNSIDVKYNSTLKNISIQKDQSIIIESSKLYSSTGSLIKKWSNEETLKVNSIPDGVYYLKINTTTGKISKKLIIH